MHNLARWLKQLTNSSSPALLAELGRMRGAAPSFTATHLWFLAPLRMAWHRHPARIAVKPKGGGVHMSVERVLTSIMARLAGVLALTVGLIVRFPLISTRPAECQEGRHVSTSQGPPTKAAALEHLVCPHRAAQPSTHCTLLTLLCLTHKASTPLPRCQQGCQGARVLLVLLMQASGTPPLEGRPAQ